MTGHRRVSGLAVATLMTCGLLAACSGADPSSPKGTRPDAVPFALPRGQTGVAAPGPDDVVLTDPARPAPVTTVDRPNIVMITMDDAALRDMEYMPHLQELIADEGVTLDNGIDPTPLCVPSRASTLTGQYASNHGAQAVAGVNGGYSAFDDSATLPVALEEAGYDTIMVGKYLNGYTAQETSHTPPGWTTWRPTVDPSTYNYFHPKILIDGEIVATDTYSTTLISDQSNELLEQRSGNDRPFYMWVNYVAPHHGGPHEDDDPFAKGDDPDQQGIGTPAREERDRGTFADLDLPDTPEIFEADPSDKGIIRNVRRPKTDARKGWVRVARQQRVESLQAVDRAIARTVATLSDNDLLDDTYLVVTSDNGYATGEHNLEDKLWYFHDIVKVPMYIRGPGLAPGTTSNAPVTQADWAPTFARLAKATMPDDPDGSDVLPWLASDATRRVVPIAAWPVKGGTTPLYTGVVVGPWTYVVGRNGRAEMYNTTLDPYQLENLARDPRFRSQRRELARLTREYVDCAGETCHSAFLQ